MSSSCCMCHKLNGLPLPLGGVLLFSVNLWVSMERQQWQLHEAQPTLGWLQDCCAPRQWVSLAFSPGPPCCRLAARRAPNRWLHTLRYPLDCRMSVPTVIMHYACMQRGQGLHFWVHNGTCAEEQGQT